MEQIKKLWNSFLELKAWKKIVVILFVLSFISVLGGSGTSSSDSSNSSAESDIVNDKSTPEPTQPTPEPTQPTPEPTKPVVTDKEYKAALARMRIKSDAVKDLKFYTPVSAPRYANANGFYIYIGESGGSNPYLRFTIQYYGDDWLFIESFFFNVDGETFEISTSYGEMERDNDSDVWEWYDVSPTMKNIEMLEKIMNSKKTVMRMEGQQYYKDKTITAAQKSAIRDTFLVFQGLGGTL